MNIQHFNSTTNGKHFSHGRMDPLPEGGQRDINEAVHVLKSMVYTMVGKINAFSKYFVGFTLDPIISSNGPGYHIGSGVLVRSSLPG